MMEDVIQYAKAAGYIAAAFTMGIGTIGPALAQGMIGSKACENVIKTDQTSDLYAMTFLSLALVESGLIYCLLVAGVLLYFAGAS
jgi:F-type H+-transporting ATPase subunit c